LVATGFTSTRFGEWGVVIENDGRVAYAYLLRYEEIVSEVWLFNAVIADERPEWDRDGARSLLPFLNPPSMGRVISSPPAIGDSLNWRVDWDGLSNCGPVRIAIEGELWAELEPGVVPGSSRLAIV
jgi:hypothetical protein